MFVYQIIKYCLIRNVCDVLINEVNATRRRYQLYKKKIGTFVCTKYYLIIFNTNNICTLTWYTVHATVFMFCFLFYNHPYKRLLIYNPNLNFKMKSHNTMR